MKVEQLKEELRRLTNELMVESATSEPFEFYFDEEHTGDELNEKTVRKLAGMPANYPLEVLSVQDFFEEYGGNNQERNKQLQETLQRELQDVKAYCVGEVRRTVLLIGKTENNEVAGLKTALTRPY